MERYLIWLQSACSLPAKSKKKQENHKLRHSICSCHHSTFSLLQISMPCDSMIFLLLHDGRQTISHTHSYFTGQQSYNGELSLVKTLKPVGLQTLKTYRLFQPTDFEACRDGASSHTCIPFPSVSQFKIRYVKDVKDNRPWRWVLSWVCWEPGMKCKN